MLTVMVVRKDGSETTYPAQSVVYLTGYKAAGKEDAGPGVLIRHTELTATHVSEGDVYIMAEGKTVHRYYLRDGEGDARAERDRRVRAAGDGRVRKVRGGREGSRPGNGGRFGA